MGHHILYARNERFHISHRPIEVSTRRTLHDERTENIKTDAIAETSSVASEQKDS